MSHKHIYLYHVSNQCLIRCFLLLGGFFKKHARETSMAKASSLLLFLRQEMPKENWLSTSTKLVESTFTPRFINALTILTAPRELQSRSKMARECSWPKQLYLQFIVTILHALNVVWLALRVHSAWQEGKTWVVLPKVASWKWGHLQL